MYRWWLLALAVSASGDTAVPRVEDVIIEGSSPAIEMQTREGAALDLSTIAADTKQLYATGRVHDVTAAVSDGATGKIVTFRVVPARVHVLREIRYIPSNPPAKLPVPERLPLHAANVSRLESEMRNMLHAQGYGEPVVRAEVLPVDTARADVVLRIETGDSLKVGKVEFLGETAIGAKALRSAIKDLQGRTLLPGIPGIWGGWKLSARYGSDLPQAGAARLTSLYLSRGYFDALVRPDNVSFTGKKANIAFALDPGTQYSVRKWTLEGEGLQPRSETVRQHFRADSFCACLFDIRRESEKLGYVDFNVRARLSPNPDGSTDFIARIDRGRPYTVRRIEIKGNRRFSDSTIRANLLVDEAEPLDQTLLRKSLARINQSRMFEPLDERSVELRTDAATGMADIRIHLRERRPGSWLLSGPVGPMSLAGPLQFALASRLPAWGRGILEGATYFASFSLLAQADPFSKLLTGSTSHVVRPILTISRPFSPGLGWKSGFVIAPQLGWRAMGLSYGMTQLRERIVPLLAGDTRFMSPIPVTVERESGEAVMLCDAPDPSWKWLRVGATLTLQFGTSFLTF